MGSSPIVSTRQVPGQAGSKPDIWSGAHLIRPVAAGSASAILSAERPGRQPNVTWSDSDFPGYCAVG